jgi:DNA polymerase alpha-associated DNA helicase A
MAWLPKTDQAKLDTWFRFDEDSFPGAACAWASQLRFGTGSDDGERYLLRLFKKSLTALDDDLSRLIARGLRRIRRVLSSHRSRDLLVEVQKVVEDRDELAIVMLDPGSPIAGSSRAIRARHSLFLTGAARKIFWRNIKRVAEALAICHAGGLFTALSANTRFSLTAMTRKTIASADMRPACMSVTVTSEAPAIRYDPREPSPSDKTGWTLAKPPPGSWV